VAISPPSDLVLDVVRAADPADVQAAQEKLKATRAAVAATSLAEKGEGFASAVDLYDTANQRAGLGNVQKPSVDKVPESYRQFESMVLQNFVKSMLPTESENIYGKGTAGEMWKGMMAEQMGASLAKNGGVGIAEQMYAQSLTRAQNKGVNNAALDQNDHKLAMSMVTDFERRTFTSVAPETQKSDES